MGNSETIFEGEFNSLQNCLEDAIRQNICLDYIDLRGANLINADLDEGSFNYARFDHANLTGANLSASQLNSANFKNATLYNTCLCEASMVNANFFGASFGAVDVAWSDMSSTCFDTLSALDLVFTDTKSSEGALFYDRTGAICSMSYPPIVIKGLEYKVVLFDDYMKVGSAVFDYNTWQKLRNHGAQTKLDQNIEGFIRLYGPFLFTLADIRTPMTKHLNAKREKNVA